MTANGGSGGGAGTAAEMDAAVGPVGDAAAGGDAAGNNGGWVSIFNGKDLTGGTRSSRATLNNKTDTFNTFRAHPAMNAHLNSPTRATPAGAFHNRFGLLDDDKVLHQLPRAGRVPLLGAPSQEPSRREDTGSMLFNHPHNDCRHSRFPAPHRDSIARNAQRGRNQQCQHLSARRNDRHHLVRQAGGQRKLRGLSHRPGASRSGVGHRRGRGSRQRLHQDLPVSDGQAALTFSGAPDAGKAVTGGIAAVGEPALRVSQNRAHAAARVMSGAPMNRTLFPWIAHD